MAFTAQDVKTLREMTNVGMMDCKKALQATDGDMDKAVDWLREKGLAKAAKKAGRIAAEGMAYAEVCPKCGVGAIVEVNCETDFCAKSDLFVAFVKDICKVVRNDAPADVEALLNCKYPGSDLTVSEILPEKVMSIGENLQIRRFARFDRNTSVAYVHAGGTRGVLVNLAVEGDIDATEIGKNVAMQIAAMNPKYWDKALVPQEDVDHELQVQVALMDNDPKMASKPAAIKEKIAAGKMAAFYKENCLLQQEFVRSDLFSGSVEGYIADAAKKLGGSVKFVDAIHFVKGEGIEKKQEDFAAEVAAQMNMGK
ncbi:MAG: elongation factor Ts [Oscillospiraceae bacterium]|nr:elongation factor Ts [Oscillospiraceae bacterium]